MDQVKITLLIGPVLGGSGGGGGQGLVAGAGGSGTNVKEMMVVLVTLVSAGGGGGTKWSWICRRRSTRTPGNPSGNSAGQVEQDNLSSPIRIVQLQFLQVVEVVE